jgi:hypothetical protein
MPFAGQSHCAISARSSSRSAGSAVIVAVGSAGVAANVDGSVGAGGVVPDCSGEVDAGEVDARPSYNWPLPCPTQWVPSELVMVADDGVLRVVDPCPVACRYLRETKLDKFANSETFIPHSSTFQAAIEYSGVRVLQIRSVRSEAASLAE